MRITRIDLEGRPQHFAMLCRSATSATIDVHLVTPALTRMHHVDAESEDDIESMAECLAFHLDGGANSPGAVARYRRVLQQMTNG